MDRGDLRRVLGERGVRLNPAAEALFADVRFRTRSRPRVVTIEARSVAELGFACGATWADLTAAARVAGLVACPLELGPHLRLQLPDQPDGGEATAGRAPPGSLTVVSPPLDDTDETPKGFYLRRVDGVEWLRGYRSWDGHVWSPEDVLVFARA